MFQAPDYTILDHLTEVCEVVDPNFRYVYVNEAAVEREHCSREQMLGKTMLELHPDIKSTSLFRNLKACLEEQKSVEFEDNTFYYPNSTVKKWMIKMDPAPEGVFIHSVAVSTKKTKVKIKKTKEAFTYCNIIRELSRSLEMEGWLDALDSRTRETNDHILRVTNGTVILARMAGVSDSEIKQIRRGALLHDIGKTGVPDVILLKSGRLTTDEWEVIRKHPIYAHDLVYPIEYLRNCLDIPYSHHEKWDGTGYPQGLIGEQIPLSARLFAVVDVWDTLSFDRVYRKAWPREEVMEYIQQQSGFHFDPNIVDLFFRANNELMSLRLS